MNCCSVCFFYLSPGRSFRVCCSCCHVREEIFITDRQSLLGVFSAGRELCSSPPAACVLCTYRDFLPEKTVQALCSSKSCKAVSLLLNSFVFILFVSYILSPKIFLFPCVFCVCFGCVLMFFQQDAFIFCLVFCTSMIIIS